MINEGVKNTRDNHGRFVVPPDQPDDPQNNRKSKRKNKSRALFMQNVNRWTHKQKGILFRVEINLKIETISHRDELGTRLPKCDQDKAKESETETKQNG